MNICLTLTTESSTICVGGSRKTIIVQRRHGVHEVFSFVSISNPLIQRRSLECDNTTDIITLFHIGDEYVLSVFITDIILLVEDQCPIDNISIIITGISGDGQISLDWYRFALIGLVPEMNRIKLEME